MQLPPTMHFPGLPVDMTTESLTPGLRRLQVDVGQTGFFAGREFRIFKEYTVGATPLVFRVIVPSTLRGIILQSLRVSCYQGGIIMRTYRDGTPGGSWTPEVIWPNNGIPDVPGYVGQVTIQSGGTLTGSSGASDALAAFANETGKSATTSMTIAEGERGLPAGTYYLEVSRITGVSVDSLGIISGVFEERTLETV